MHQQNVVTEFSGARNSQKELQEKPVTLTPDYSFGAEHVDELILLMLTPLRAVSTTVSSFAFVFGSKFTFVSDHVFEP